MVKSCNRNLKGKIWIIRKPRPVENEFKTLCDGSSKVVLHIEFYEGKDIMRQKKYVKEFGATTACTLRLSEYWKNSGRIVIGDSWFGSVKTAVQLMLKNGLYSILLVKTAHKNFPKRELGEAKAVLERGERVSAESSIEGVDLLAVRFKDLKEKQFISTCSSSTEGPPRITKHHGEVTRPQVAADYLAHAAGIDIHNHVRQGKNCFEDVWQTKSSHIRQYAGILSFLFSNAYLASKYFQDKSKKHLDFKMDLANMMVEFKDTEIQELRATDSPGQEPQSYHGGHTAAKFTEKGKKFQKKCFFCQHGRPEPARRNTSYYCLKCGKDKPLCSPLVRDCFMLHEQNGMPAKRRFSK